ncbi:amidase family protein [Stappia indica]|uniref:amidase family protein n=1 Tax=Stappia indica TaxID=538381 RepID=UPI001CD56535|nr:amidase family protein [Stappia indica]MCA1298647.1 glutamyl-tRNA amidotransferase [Stappia indica]
MASSPHVSASDPTGSLVERLSIPPYRGGVLDGLRFTVKDNIDLAGRKTSYGSPAWRDAHAAPQQNALCVDQLLAAGGTCVGKVVADEFTYSLDGESHFFGTPVNARAPERVPGGSSSGSAASVAGGLADFSLGTDSGGSIRVPASLCGLWGMRPSLHRISEAGVLPFMPSVSTVGAVADRFAVLDKAMRVLLRSAPEGDATAGGEPAVERLLILEDAFALCDGAVARAAEEALAAISARAGIVPERVRFSDLVGRDMGLADCNAKALRNLQTAEFQNTGGNWIETHAPELGAVFTMAYGNVRAFDRIAALDSLALCERLFEAINAALPQGTVICFPTTPVIAPLKGSLTSLEAVLAFYDPTMAITSFSGVGRLPEITAPLLTVEGAPVGLSFAARHYGDEALLAATRALLQPE